MAQEKPQHTSGKHRRKPQNIFEQLAKKLRKQNEIDLTAETILIPRIKE